MPKPDMSNVTTLSAREEVMFVSDTAPADGSETDPSSYTVAGLPQDISFSSEREEIRGSNKLQTFGTVHIGDGSFNMDGTFERPVEVDAGQELIRANHFKDPVPPLYFLLLAYDDEGNAVRAVYGQVKVASFELGSSNNEIATFSSTFAGNLAPTIEDISGTTA